MNNFLAEMNGQDRFDSVLNGDETIAGGSGVGSIDNPLSELMSIGETVAFIIIVFLSTMAVIILLISIIEAYASPSEDEHGTKLKKVWATVSDMGMATIIMLFVASGGVTFVALQILDMIGG